MLEKINTTENKMKEEKNTIDLLIVNAKEKSSKAPFNLIEMFSYQKFLDSKINNIKPRTLKEIRFSFLAELVEFNEETPETHKTWKARVIDNRKILEELTDVYFFFSQIVNYLFEKGQGIFSNKSEEEQERIFIKLENNFDTIVNQNFIDDKMETLLLLSETVSKKDLDILFLIKLMSYLTKQYGFTREDILKSYYDKWKKNLERIGTEWR